MIPCQLPMPQPTPVYLDNAIQPYGWGSRTSIATIQRRSPSDSPEAELWIGVHPAGPSQTRAAADRDQRSLIDLLHQDGSQWLGHSRANFGDSLPFLLKILAAAEPLSLQVHPDKLRAQQLFQSHPGSPYVDANHKPELLCALTSFAALHGFRPIDQIQRNLMGFPAPPPRLATAISRFVGAPTESGLRQLLATLISLSRSNIDSVARSLDQWVDSNRSAEPPATLAAITKLRRHHPDDALAIAPLLMNTVTLEPGEALYTGPGVLHSYLEGTGVELMANSDNVVRAGLTSKRIDPSELLHVTRFEPQPSLGVGTRTTPDSAFLTFVTPAAEFELSRLDWNRPQSCTEPDAPEVQILLATAGDFTMTPSESSGGGAMPLPSGESMLIPARFGAYTLEGTGTLFRATVPS